MESKVVNTPVSRDGDRSVSMVGVGIRIEMDESYGNVKRQGVQTPLFLSGLKTAFSLKRLEELDCAYL